MDLIVYQKAPEVANQVFLLSRVFPKNEMHSSTDQIRRSSRSVGGQIAEAWATRRYPNHFVSKLSVADGEEHETEHRLEIAEGCEYVKPEETAELRGLLAEIGRMLQGMMAQAEEFKGDRHGNVREKSATYGSLQEFCAA